MLIPTSLRTEVERWVLAEPFRTAAHTVKAIDLLVVTLESGGVIGRGEATGVYYKQESPASMLRQIGPLRKVIESGISRASLQKILPPGGARNALDCALWELEARLSGIAVWKKANLERPRELITTFTCGADEPGKMATRARGYKGARAIKLKLTGEPADAQRVRAVREELDSVWLAVDANQGFTRASLERLMPLLVEMRVALIEQPFPIGHEADLDGLQSPIPIAADESVQCLSDMARLVGRFNMVNIKLDKCGGLTEGLAMARAASELGLDAMVGNMLCTSLGIGPAFLVGQLCAVVDLDGPIFLDGDRPIQAQYENGLIACSESVWGA
jgi:L-Ala-D/L-Glu epimerase